MSGCGFCPNHSLPPPSLPLSNHSLTVLSLSYSLPSFLAPSLSSFLTPPSLPLSNHSLAVSALCYSLTPSLPPSLSVPHSLSPITHSLSSRPVTHSLPSSLPPSVPPSLTPSRFSVPRSLSPHSLPVFLTSSPALPQLAQQLVQIPNAGDCVQGWDSAGAALPPQRFAFFAFLLTTTRRDWCHIRTAQSLFSFFGS